MILLSGSVREKCGKWGWHEMERNSSLERPIDLNCLGRLAETCDDLLSLNYGRVRRVMRCTEKDLLTAGTKW